MKLKPYKEKQSFISNIKNIFSISQSATPSSVNIDINGCINLENFKKIIDYSDEMIEIETKNKRVYIYGKDLVITSCNRYSATVFGDIEKIEMYEKEIKQCSAE